MGFREKEERILNRQCVEKYRKISNISLWLMTCQGIYFSCKEFSRMASILHRYLISCCFRRFEADKVLWCGHIKLNNYQALNDFCLKCAMCMFLHKL